jgi:hypothetical protein
MEDVQSDNELQGQFVGLVDDGDLRALNQDIEAMRDRLRIVVNEIQQHRIKLAIRDLQFLIELGEGLRGRLQEVQESAEPRLQVLPRPKGGTPISDLTP